MKSTKEKKKKKKTKSSLLYVYLKLRINPANDYHCSFLLDRARGKKKIVLSVVIPFRMMRSFFFVV